MKLVASDFRQLQLSLLAALLMIAAATGAALLALHANQSANLESAHARNERNGIESKLNRMRREENQIKEESALFNALEKRGVIGSEQRLDWVEQLKTIRDQRRIPELKYEIAAQRRLDNNAAGNLNFFASTMTLQMKLLHEEDLTRLLADLRQQANALTQVRSCTVERLPKNETERNPGANLLANLFANCQIDWITIDQAVANDGGRQ